MGGNVMSLKMRIEFKLADLWVGAFWKRALEECVETEGDEAVMVTAPRVDVWICLVPMLPLHIVWRGRESRSEAMRYCREKSLAEIAETAGWVRSEWGGHEYPTGTAAADRVEPREET
jgi:hypothetical protein